MSPETPMQPEDVARLVALVTELRTRAEAAETACVQKDNAFHEDAMREYEE